jgi:hypothetical protein
VIDRDALARAEYETELEGFDDWPFQKKAALLTVLHIAALTGVFVYPMRRDGLPDAG